jgi:hypothetical protein
LKGKEAILVHEGRTSGIASAFGFFFFGFLLSPLLGSETSWHSVLGGRYLDVL